MWIDTLAGSERESRPRGSLNHLYGHFFPVSFGQSSCCAWFRVHIWYVLGSSPVCTSLSQDGFHRRGLWVVDITPLLTPKELSSREGFLDFGNEKYVVSYLLSGQGPAPSGLSCYSLGVLVHRERISNCLPWGRGGAPIYRLPQSQGQNRLPFSCRPHCSLLGPLVSLPLALVSGFLFSLPWPACDPCLSVSACCLCLALLTILCGRLLHPFSFLWIYQWCDYVLNPSSEEGNPDKPHFKPQLSVN